MRYNNRPIDKISNLTIFVLKSLRISLNLTHNIAVRNINNQT